MRKDMTADRLHEEEEFHDQWAESVDVTTIDVDKMNEAITAPEMRYIVDKLGDIRNKTILDIGCGLGEASVYFAKKGAIVTSTDISLKMLGVARRLAERNGVTIETIQSSAESLTVENRLFDIIYIGNLFHHVDIEAALGQITKMMKVDSILVSWDPLAYNPIINVYRRIADKVRTTDEHPLTMSDLRTIGSSFQDVSYRYFWLFTLVIFVIMSCVQFRSPNKERFWKVIITEADKWQYLYRPLKRIDDFVLRAFPFLGMFCWNVVVFAGKPKG